MFTPNPVSLKYIWTLSLINFIYLSFNSKSAMNFAMLCIGIFLISWKYASDQYYTEIIKQKKKATYQTSPLKNVGEIFVFLYAVFSWILIFFQSTKMSEILWTLRVLNAVSIFFLVFSVWYYQKKTHFLQHAFEFGKNMANVALKNHTGKK